MRLCALVWLLSALLAAAQPQVQTETLAQGQGPPVQQGDHLSIAYQLSLSDGQVVDSTPPDKSFQLEVGAEGIIPGLSQGVLGMKRGETRKIIVPPELGYGGAQVGSIPPNSTLIFEVQLLYSEPEQEPGHEHEAHGHEAGDQPANPAHGQPGHDHSRHEGESQHGHDPAQESEDGSFNRPHANDTNRPAIMEYLTRDFYSRPWRFADASHKLWRASAVLTLLAAAVAVAGVILERRRFL